MVHPISALGHKRTIRLTSAYSQRGDGAFKIPPQQSHELPGCNFAVQRKLAEQVGGFHPDLDRSGAGMLGGGDWEFGEKLTKAGANVWYVPECGIQHLISAHKLSKQGMRDRWWGMGATQRMMARIRGDDEPGFYSQFRNWVKVCRLLLASWVFRIAGNSSGGLQRELQARRHIGFLTQ